MAHSSGRAPAMRTPSEPHEILVDVAFAWFDELAGESR